MPTENGKGLAEAIAAGYALPRRGKWKPTKLTPAIQELIVEFIKDERNYFCTAAERAGLRKEVADEWLLRGEGRDRKGRKPSEPYISFAKAVREAEAEREAKNLAIIRAAAVGGTKTPEVQVFQQYEITTLDDGAQIRKLVKETRKTIIRQEPPQWAAAAFMLSRQVPERWGKRLNVDVGADLLTGVVLLPSKAESMEEWQRQMDKQIAANANKSGHGNGPHGGSTG